MKGLLTAFTVLSFVAASSLPIMASAQEMNHDQPMADHNSAAGTEHASPAPTMHPETTHKTTHRVTHHKRTVHHKVRPKHTVRAKHHKTATMPPKAG